MIIIAAVLVTGLVALATAQNMVFFAIGLIPAVLGAGLVIGAYLWIDRWEPEPPRLLIFAFVWGGGFTVVWALIIGQILSAVGFLNGPFSSIAIQAPLVEEFGKGMFLWLMLTGLRRKELNTLTDCLVYAGMVGIGFAFVEDLLYFTSQHSLGGAILTIVIRLALGVFAHPLFTSMTAIGVFLSLRQKSAVGRFGCLLLGYLGAVLLHGLWNGSTALGLQGYLITYGVVMVPVFVGAVLLARRSRRREGEIVLAQLPAMVQARLVAPQEAGWLSSLGSRKLRLQAAKSAGGKDGARQIAQFADAVTELAFVRDRLDHGLATPALLQQHDALVQTIQLERAQVAPQLNQLSAQSSPVTGAPMQPTDPLATYNPIPGGP
ncbi:PrsW family intramembrane metalloprotease [Microlunatus panaciterrae]